VPVPTTPWERRPTQQVVPVAPLANASFGVLSVGARPQPQQQLQQLQPVHHHHLHQQPQQQQQPSSQQLQPSSSPQKVVFSTEWSVDEVIRYVTSFDPALEPHTDILRKHVSSRIECIHWYIYYPFLFIHFSMF
jgi:hypothetical protein